MLLVASRTLSSLTLTRRLLACNATLHTALFNKGTAFKVGERDRLRFRGLLPARIMNIQLQKDRFLQTLRAETSKIKQNILLEDLHDRNETLYHRVLVEHVSALISSFTIRTLFALISIPRTCCLKH